MNPAGAYFLLTLFFACPVNVPRCDPVIKTYDAHFKTFEECKRMGNLMLTGIDGPVYRWKCNWVMEN